jgi:BRCA1/BRCA2-containing complex subunit 3
MMRRSDKRPDRVEISPEHLSAAAIEAEALGERLCRPIKVTGWYHSHPHITVWPSHVDVRTQADYQLMSPNFFGLIFSCFHEVEKKCEIQVICFQSVLKSTNM